MTGRGDDLESVLCELTNALTECRKVLRRARQQLEVYGRHLHECRIAVGDLCSCGFDDVLRR